MQREITDDYIAGFVDGEGCFALKYRADRKYSKDGELIKEYFYWGAEFAIVLHPSDAELLELIKEKLGVGYISYKKAGDQVRYSVQAIHDLNNTIVPFFNSHKLIGNKRKDFKLWAEAVVLLAGVRASRVSKNNPITKSLELKLRAIKLKIDLHKRRDG